MCYVSVFGKTETCDLCFVPASSNHKLCLKVLSGKMLATPGAQAVLAALPNLWNKSTKCSSLEVFI